MEKDVDDLKAKHNEEAKVAAIEKHKEDVRSGKVTMARAKKLAKAEHASAGESGTPRHGTPRSDPSAAKSAGPKSPPGRKKSIVQRTLETLRLSQDISQEDEIPAAIARGTRRSSLAMIADAVGSMLGGANKSNAGGSGANASVRVRM